MNTDNSHKQTEFHKNFTVILNNPLTIPTSEAITKHANFVKIFLKYMHV
jgi:hypothetical protein